MATAKQIAARKKFAAIMKSGGFKKRKSNKSKTKSAKKRGFQVPKTATKKRNAKRLTTKSNTRKSMPRKAKSRARKAGMKISNVLKSGLVGKVVAGVGGGAVVSLVMSRVAPQYAGIGSVAGGFLSGGLIGGAANLIFSGGLNSIGSILMPTQTTSQEGGMSV